MQLLTLQDKLFHFSHNICYTIIRQTNIKVGEVMVTFSQAWQAFLIHLRHHPSGFILCANLILMLYQ